MLVSSNARVRSLVEQLGLAPHPEGGYYRETYRAPTEVPARGTGVPRAASTAIYFLVTPEVPATRIHRLRHDEVFHLYEGGPLDIRRFHPDGTSDDVRLGRNLEAGQRPQHVFGTELVPGAEYCLVGCTVAPGFDFADFEMIEAPELTKKYPARAATIQRMYAGPALRTD
jgi:predicted cupin superfamily sugar epimerase